MKKFHSGKLKSGGSGKKVTNPSQAVAIMLSEKAKADAGDAEYMPDRPESQSPAAGMKKRAVRPAQFGRKKPSYL